MLEPSAPAASPPRLWRAPYVATYVVLAAALVAQVGQFHDSRTGFSSMLVFGQAFRHRRLARLRDIPIYTYGAAGYDGQFYAQLAVAGNPLDPELGTALDSAPYRMRRILLPVLVHLAGLGRPAWVLEAYALSNPICWLVLALLLARWWFPPTDVHNLLRWAGTLFGEGMLASIRCSLTDAPALLFIALGVRLVEKNRRLAGRPCSGPPDWCARRAPLRIGVSSGNKRRTAGLAPRGAGRRDLRSPDHRLGRRSHCPLRFEGSARNFDLPLASYVRKLGEIYDGWRANGFGHPIPGNVWTVIALGTQVGFLLARPKSEKIWWRVGASFSILWLCLGWAVWEGPSPAAARAVLPLTLAFNVLAPRSRGGLALLVAGNLTVLSAAAVLQPPIMAPDEVFAAGVSCSYAEGWHEPESLEGRNWRWASGPATLQFHNPTTETQRITLEFQIASVTDRTVTMRAPDLERSFTFRAAPKRLPATFGPFLLPPGDTRVVFTTAEPPWLEEFAGGRRLAFSLEDLHSRAPAVGSN